MNGVNGYSITVNKDTRPTSALTFPRAMLADLQLSYFSLPRLLISPHSGYSLSGSGMIDVSKDGKELFTALLPSLACTYLIESGACAAGKLCLYFQHC